MNAPDLVPTVRLALVSGVGPRIRKSLIEWFGSAEAVLAAPPSELRRVRGVGQELSRRIAEATEQIDVEAEIELCREHDIDIIVESHENYPRLLREIPDPPGVLFMQGELLPQDAISIAVVGSRHASHYGLRQAERLAGELTRAGLTVVSGMARGIDGKAHRGALAAAGRTVAVLASGLLNVYPPEHQVLARQIVSSGALLSEAPLRSPPQSGTFPQRNRLISGLSLGVIVVEAADRSGALITARHAMEQGREVFAVPGQVDRRGSRGCHRLIRDGAKLVESVDDVLEELGPLVEPTPREDGQVVHDVAELTLNDLEKKVLAAIATDPTSIDQVVADTDLPVPRVLSTVSVLEMRRLVRRLSGTTVART